MPRILIVEDDQAIRQTTEYALRREGYEVRTVADGADALGAIGSFGPDLIVLDIMLPNVDGLQITQALRDADNDTAIIMVSALGDEADRIAGLDLGADDYLPKPFSLAELTARIRANLRRVPEGGGRVESAATRVADLVVDPARHTVTVAGERVVLRGKEFALLQALIANGEKVSTRQWLAEQVWGYEYMGSSRTIDVHIRRLRSAVESRSAFTLIETVHGVGYLFRPVPKTGQE